MKKICLLLIAMIVAVAMVACDTQNKESDTESASESVSESASESVSESESESESEPVDIAQAALDKLAGISYDFGNNFKIDGEVSFGFSMASNGVKQDASMTGSASLTVTEKSGALTVTVPEMDSPFTLVFDTVTDAVYMTYQNVTVAVTDFVASLPTVLPDIQAFIESIIAEYVGDADTDMDMSQLEGITLDDLLAQFGFSQEDLLAIPGVQELLASLNSLKPTEIFASTTMTTDENGVTTITFSGISPKVYNMIKSTMDIVLQMIPASDETGSQAAEIQMIASIINGYMQQLTNEENLKIAIGIDTQNHLTAMEIIVSLPAPSADGLDASLPSLSLSEKVTVAYGDQTVSVPAMPTDPELKVPLTLFWDFVKSEIEDAMKPDNTPITPPNHDTVITITGKLVYIDIIDDNLTMLSLICDDFNAEGAPMEKEFPVYVPTSVGNTDFLEQHFHHTVTADFYIYFSEHDSIPCVTRITCSSCHDSINFLWSNL